MNDYTYLAHHGVKGMKWGVRRYMNKDGSLTPEGKKRYSSEYEKSAKEFAKAKDAYRRSQTSHSLERLEKAKIDYDREKAKAKIDKKSEGFKRAEKKYKEKYNLTDEEAEYQAYKSQRAKKIIAASAAVAVTAAAAYAAYKHYDNNVDKFIKPGQTLQNINPGGMDFTKPFYTSKNRLDNAKYRGMYSTQMKRQRGIKDVMETKLKVGGSGIKVASRKSAIDTTRELIENDSDFRNNLGAMLKSYDDRIPVAVTPQQRAMKKAYASFKNGKVDKNLYDGMNVLLVDKSEHGTRVREGLYKKLKEKGYDAISDVNDKKYSGYKSSSPLIVFGNSAGDKIVSETSRKLTNKEISRSRNVGYAHILGSDLAKKGAAVTAGVLGLQQATKRAQNKQDLETVREYKKMHPNTKLSDREIIKMTRE